MKSNVPSSLDNTLMAVQLDNSGILHFVNPINVIKTPIEDGFRYTIQCWDATLQEYVYYEITGIGNHPGYDMFFDTNIMYFLNLEDPENIYSDYGYGYGGYSLGYGSGYGFGYGYDEWYY
jgi:hypothetical protein